MSVFRDRGFFRAAVWLCMAMALLLWVQRGDAGQQARGASASPSKRFVSGRLVVKFHAGTDEFRKKDLISDTGAVVEKHMDALDIHILKLPNGASEQGIANSLLAHSEVEFAELDEQVEPSRIPNDPLYGSQWHLPRIGAPQAWDTSIGNSGLVVAVLDTGVDPSHPDLQPKLVPGWNTYNNTSDTGDVYGHGTAVAGTFAAATDNWSGAAGVIWNCLIMPIRISDGSGYALYTDAAEALTWAADHGARVANLSYAMSTSSTVTTAAKYFQDHGGVVVMAAGNDGATVSISDNPYVLTVSATDASDSVTSWSNRGSIIDLSAPGDYIYTTTSGGGYGAWSGTSFSSPIVAGVAALVFAVNPNLSGSQVQSILKNSADDLGANGWDPNYGAGRVNASNAVTLALIGGGGSTDTTPPSVAFSFPALNATILGTVSVQVSATDASGISSVSLTVDGSNWGTDTATPYAFGLDTTKLVNGTHTLSSTAMDVAGNKATASITVLVSNIVINPTLDTTSPTDWFNSPQDGAKVSGNINISASASDDVGVVRMELYIDSVLKATSTTASISSRWNTKPVKAGAHTLTVKAYDAAGNAPGVSSITVNK